MQSLVSRTNFFSLLFIIFTLSSYSQSWKWVTSAGGSSSDKALDIDIDSLGNLYICGFYNGGNGSDPNDVYFGNIAAADSAYGKEAFLAKIDSSGTWQWLAMGPGWHDERALGLCVDQINGFVYVTGTTWEAIKFGNCPEVNSNDGGADDIFIAKFDFNGNCIWVKEAGGYEDDHGYDLVTDRQGNIYLTGFITNDYGYDYDKYFGNITVSISTDSLAFVTKISPSGAFQWVKTFNATDGERDNRIAIDASDNIYVTGAFWGTKMFETTSVTSKGGKDIFVVKFDSNGNQIWVKTTGSTLDDRGNSITVDKYGDIYITGEFRDKVAFGTDTINNNGGPNGRDIFVAKITKDGNWVWAKKAGDNGGTDKGTRIISNKKNDYLYVTGEFKGNASFGGNITLNNNDSTQIFVAAIDTSGKWKWAIQAGCPLEEDRGTGIAVDDSCNLYVTGYYATTSTFGALSTSALGRKDVFVSRINEACSEFVPPDTTTPPTQPPPVVLECTPSIPNIFTPNNDNENENISVIGICINRLSLSIYNRWGIDVHQLKEPGEKWDGMINGQPASEGVYYYLGKAYLDNGDIVDLKGFITLIR